MPPTRTTHNTTVQSIFMRDSVPPDFEGPLLSVSSIIAIVIGLILFLLAFTALLVLFPRLRTPGSTAPRTDAYPRDGPYYEQRDVEIAEISASRVTIAAPPPAFTPGPRLPSYTGKSVGGLPEYFQEAPPSFPRTPAAE